MKKNVFLVVFTIFATLAGVMFYNKYTDLQKKQEATTEILNAIQKNSSDTEKKTNTELTAYTLRELIRPSAKLVTAEYIYSNAAEITDYKSIKNFKIPFTTEKIVFTYSGTIQVGVDLTEVQFDVNNDSKIIYITLPKAEKVSHEIDMNSYKFETVKNSWFNDIDAEEFNKEAKAQKRNMELKAEETGTVYREAESNVKSVIRDIFDRASITQGYHYQFVLAD